MNETSPHNTVEGESATTGATGSATGASFVRALIKLARPHQWAKTGFVALGPFYGGAFRTPEDWMAIIGAIAAFGFAASACYVLNDLSDREADRAHPRKRRRPIASGLVSPRAAVVYAGVLYVLACLGVGLVALGPVGPVAAGWVGLAVGVYVLNVNLYTYVLKHSVMLDVVSLAIGFVLRVLGGCAAVAVEPSTWLLNVTFFLAMFLAFGKRLGERRTAEGEVGAIRAVQTVYTSELLRMSVVVTAVATLLTYAAYVQEMADQYTLGFNLLWLSILPATYALLRCIVLVERGVYDDPTELAARDRPFQLAAVLFAAITFLVMSTMTPTAWQQHA